MVNEVKEKTIDSCRNRRTRNYSSNTTTTTITGMDG